MCCASQPRTVGRDHRTGFVAQAAPPASKVIGPLADLTGGAACASRKPFNRLMKKTGYFAWNGWADCLYLARTSCTFGSFATALLIA